MTFVSAFVFTEQVTNIAVLFTFGLLGYTMNRSGYSVPAFTLGFVMGDLAERYFLQALNSFGAGFLFSSPLTIVLTVIVLVTLFYNQLAKGFRRFRRKIQQGYAD